MFKLVLIHKPEKLELEEAKKSLHVIKEIGEFLGVDTICEIVYRNENNPHDYAETLMDACMPDVRIEFNPDIYNALATGVSDPMYKEAVITIVHEFIHIMFKQWTGVTTILTENNNDSARLSIMVMEEEVEKMARGLAKSFISYDKIMKAILLRMEESCAKGD